MRYTMGTRSISCAALLIFTLLNGCGGDSSSDTALTVPETATIFYSHSVAFKNNSSVIMAWGYNGYGQVGLDPTRTANSAVPNRVEGLAGMSGFAVGSNHMLAFQNNSTVRAWGYNKFGQVGPSIGLYSANPLKVAGLSGVTAVAAGGYHSVALKNDGTVWTWGNNETGQLGNTAQTVGVPVQVITDPPVNAVLLGGVVKIAAGGSHSVALKNDGTVWTWGFNGYGQLGQAHADVTSFRAAAAQVPGLTDVTDIAAGGAFTVALKSDGTVWCWGYNAFGQLGDGTIVDNTDPVQVVITGSPTAALSGVVNISAGSNHVLALKGDGTLWGWGYNGLGQLGNNASNVEQLTPVQVSGLTGTFDVVLRTVDGRNPILAVGHHSMARTSDGLWAWGNNNYNQLGFVTAAFPFFLTAPKLVSGL